VVYHRGAVLIVIGVIAGQAGRPQLTYTYASNTANAALTMSSISGYVSGKSDIIITVNAGIYLYSTSTATPGFALTGGASGDTVKIVNNGFIMGMGGTYAVGGPALSLSFNTTVDNTNASAYIGGGGGGGGGGVYCSYNSDGGGGGGGGAGGANGGAGSLGGGGAGGAVGVAGSGGGSRAGGGGGRILPGTGGAGGSGQGGGAGGGSGGGGGYSGGGAGGSANAAGGAGGTYAGGGGGGWGASVGKGSAGGKAVALNANTVTWVSGNTTRVYGAIS